MRVRPFAATAFTALIALCFTVESMAKPPPWAPAHGYRAKHEPFYVGYAGHQWGRDYGILGGRCNTDEILAATGAIAGGAIGAHVSRPEDRVVATILGATIGGLLGNEIGKRIDDRDRACMGHALELARTGQTIRWTNEKSGYTYQVKPLQDLAGRCRQFELVRHGRERVEPVRLRGCSADPGGWKIAADERRS